MTTTKEGIGRRLCVDGGPLYGGTHLAGNGVQLGICVLEIARAGHDDDEDEEVSHVRLCVDGWWPA